MDLNDWIRRALEKESVQIEEMLLTFFGSRENAEKYGHMYALKYGGLETIQGEDGSVQMKREVRLVPREVPELVLRWSVEGGE